MKLAVLGEGSTCSVLLQHHGINILLDCSAEPILTVLPSLQKQGQSQHSSANRIDVCLRVPHLQRAVQTQELHAVLVTNPHALLAVPYLQQLLQQQGSKLPLHFYCTEPCYHGFQHLSQELLQLQRLLKQLQHELQQQQQPMLQQLQLHQQQMQLFSQQLLAQQQQQQHQVSMPHNAVFVMRSQQPPGAAGSWQQLQQQQQQQGGFVPAGAAASAAAAAGIPPPRPPPIMPPQPPPEPPPTATISSSADRGAAAGSAAAAAGRGGLVPTRPLPAIRPPAPPSNPPAAIPVGVTAAAATAAGGLVPPPCPPPVRPHQQPPEASALQGSAAAPSAAAAMDPSAAATQAAAAGLVPLFTAQEVEAVLNAVQIVRFGQRLQLPGCWGLTVEARPAGSSIGSAMWLLKAGTQRIAFLSPASLYPNPSAALHKPSLQNLAALIVAPGSCCPDLPGVTAGSQLLQAAAQVAVGAVMNGGKVLVPVLPSGSAVLQLLEAIPRALTTTAHPAAAAAVRYHYLSPAAADALATASSCCEYLEPARKQAVLVHGQAPFEHDRLMQRGQLTALESTNIGETSDACAAAAATAAVDRNQSSASSATAAAVEEEDSAAAAAGGDGGGVRCSKGILQDVLAAGGPCVAFVSLWSMAAGSGQQLAQQWCSDPRNLLLLPEQGPLSATWLQQCMQLQLLPAPQQTQWQVLYRPVGSTAAAAAAGIGSSASTGGCGSYTAVDGCLTARQLLQLLVAGRQQQQQQQQHIAGAADKQLLLLLGPQDRLLLETAAQADRFHLSSFCSLITLLSGSSSSSSSSTPPAPPGAGSSSSSNGSTSRPLSFQLVDLPDPLLEIHLTRDLAKTLQLTPLVPLTANRAAAAAAAAVVANFTSPAAGSTTPAAVQSSTFPFITQEAIQSAEAVQPGSTNGTSGLQVSAARVRALLTHQAGAWRLEPLPGGTKPEAVAAAMDLQQQGEAGMMLFGNLELTTLLGDLQESGFSSVYLDSATAAGENGSTELVRVVKLTTSEGSAEIWLSPGTTEVVCDSWALRKQLVDVLMKQLHVIM